MTAELYSINKSRIGYAYQYKYTLLQLLKSILSGRLAEVYVDFPFTYSRSINLSLDARFEFKTPDETHIYEIKSGNDFKEDKIEELKIVLRNLYFYEQAYEIRCKKFIIFTPEAKSRILDHWADFQAVKEKIKTRLDGERQRDIQKRLYRQFEFENFSVSRKDFIDFVKAIEFIIGPCYMRDNEFDKLSDLEDQIVSEIDNFCKDLKIMDSAILIPSWSIAVELLEILTRCSENNKESLKEICNKFTDCLSRRKLLGGVRYPEGNKENILSEMKTDIGKYLIEKVKINFLEEKIPIKD